MPEKPASTHGTLGPHADQPIRSAGPSLKAARAALVLVHGRGASAESILSLYEEFGAPPMAALAPQAAGHTWYPQSFLAPLAANQPGLDSALARLESIVREILAAGVPSERIAMLGFSQGACLTVEFAARHPRRYGAIIGLTGGLIGPPGTPRDYPGTLGGTPVFLGSGDPDPHVPFERVEETQRVLERMGAVVELRRYPGMPHGINQEELDAARGLLERVTATGGQDGNASRPTDAP
jgi:predicted esterase